MPKYIEKRVDLVGYYHSGMDKQTIEQGKIELLSQWTMDGWDEQFVLMFIREYYRKEAVLATKKMKHKWKRHSYPC